MQIDEISERQPGYGEYEIDIETILRQNLPAAFNDIKAAPLSAKSIRDIPIGAKGAYLLFLEGNIVYAGKTDTRHGFRERLNRHTESVQHRVGLDPNRMTFKALRIMVFSAFDVEAILISEMRRSDRKALPWNDSGFGSNDPGKRRDDGEPAKFDCEFPVDIDNPLSNIPSGPVTLVKLLGLAKSSVPYLLRYGPLSGYDEMPVKLAAGTPTMRDALRALAGALPEEFQITIFHGRVILYKEHRNYEFAREVMRGTA